MRNAETRSGYVQNDQTLRSARRFGSDLFVFLPSDQCATDRRLFRDTSAPRIGLGWTHQQVRRLFTIGMADLDLGAQADNAIAGCAVLNWLGRGEERAQLADATLEECQRIHGIPQVEVLGRVIATGAGVAE